MKRIWRSQIDKQDMENIFGSVINVKGKVEKLKFINISYKT